MSFSAKKDEDSDAFMKIDRTAVFQEARVFNHSPINPRKCRVLLTKIALLLATGEQFSQGESTELFFSITKLFQHRDPGLRQMVYLVIKDLALVAQDVIMVTSSIMKDTAVGGDVIYRPNALRALCRIVDSTTIQAIERIFKTAIVDKSAAVSSAALVSSYHFLPIARDVVRRWANETQEAVTATKSAGASFSSSSLGGFMPGGTYMTQYHAVGLLYQIRSHDRMALIKLIQQYSGGGNGMQTPLKSPAAIVMLIRFASRVMDEDVNMRRPLYLLMEGYLRHKSDMVNFEAAKTICEMADVTDSEIAPAINTLTIFLTSPRYVCRFAAIRILNKFAMVRPRSVDSANLDIENLISDTNRSIATFAITTLLKTGNEASVDRLMKQITGFMTDITDEFKIIVVDAIRSLCLKFPSKQAQMLTFLSGVLRDEGGFEFKRSVVEALFDLINYVPESREEALYQLCEFIEDCEFTKLAVRILHLLGVEGPKTSNPTKYIRYIYNRVMLENSIVRAAAVTALTKFGVDQKDPDVTNSVRVLLTRCLDDPDDEVRDRAALNLELISNHALGTEFTKTETTFSLPAFETQLVMYVTGDTAAFAEPFDVSKVPQISKEQSDAEALKTKSMEQETIPIAKVTAAVKEVERPENVSLAHAKALGIIPEFKAFGQLLKSSKYVELTESETEYVVGAVKHWYKDHVVLQFDIKNTLTDTILDEVTMISAPEDESAFQEEFIIPINRLKPNEPVAFYASFKRMEPVSFVTTSFSNVLRFTSKEIDPTTGEPDTQGYADEYPVDDLEIGVGDYLVPTYVPNFGQTWESLGTENEASETYALSSVSSIQGSCVERGNFLTSRSVQKHHRSPVHASYWRD